MSLIYLTLHILARCYPSETFLLMSLMHRMTLQRAGYRLKWSQVNLSFEVGYSHTDELGGQHCGNTNPITPRGRQQVLGGVIV
jgi:hypothetical protein